MYPRITDPAIRGAQLRHLVKIASRPNVEIQILPFTAGVYPVPGEVFSCLSFPDPSERDIVYLESAIDDRMLEENDELDRYMLKFEKLPRRPSAPKPPSNPCSPADSRNGIVIVPLPSSNPAGEPSPADIYDYLLHGQHHSLADREAGEKALALAPEHRFAALTAPSFIARTASGTSA